MKQSNAIKTTSYVTLAGLFFILTLVFMGRIGKWAMIFAFLGAFFDWLPYIKKWMGSIGNKNPLPKRIGKMTTWMKIHIILALACYVVWPLWVFLFFNVLVGLIFFSLWLTVYLPGIFYQFFIKKLKIKSKRVRAWGKRIYIKENGKEVAHAYVYFMTNDLHEKPFAFLEDVWVDENYRGKKLGQEIVQKTIDAAREAGCYKMILTFRHSKEWLRYFYKRIGFEDHGLEFRLNFK